LAQLTEGRYAILMPPPKNEQTQVDIIYETGRLKGPVKFPDKFGGKPPRAAARDPPPNLHVPQTPIPALYNSGIAGEPISARPAGR
jgi:hypothetical protein